MATYWSETEELKAPIQKGYIPVSEEIQKELGLVPREPGIYTLTPEIKKRSIPVPLAEPSEPELPLWADLALATTLTALASRFGVPQAGPMLGKGLSSAAKAILSAPWAGAMYEAAKGALLQRPPIETLQEMPESAAWWTAFAAAPEIVGSVRSAVKSLPEGTKHPWRTYVAPPIMKAGRAIGDIPILRPVHKIFGPGVRRLLPGESLRELFIPVEERMPWMAAAAFRERAKNISFMRQAATEVSELYSKASPVERFWSYKIALDPKAYVDPEYMSLPLDVKRGIHKILEPLQQYKQLVTYKRTGQQELRVASLSLNIEDMLQKGLLRRDTVLEPTYLKPLTKVFEGRTTPGEIRKGFIEVVKHPEIPEETKKLAKDLYLLGHDLLEDLPKAAMHTETEVLKAKILSNPAWVSAKPKPGFVPSNLPEFKGLFLQKEIEEGLFGLQFVPDISRSFWNKWFMSPWKMGKVVWRVPTHFRNIMSNIILNDVGGMHVWHPSTWKAYRESARQLKVGGKEAQDFAKLTGLSVSFHQAELAPFLDAFRKQKDIWSIADSYLKRVAAKVSDPILKGAERLGKWYQMEETWAKLAKYIHNVRYKGMNPREAADDAVRWTFNYGEVTPFVKHLRASIMPFATWTTKVIPLMLEASVKNPLKVLFWASIGSTLTALSLRNLNMSEEEWRQIRDRAPDHIRNGIIGLLPFRDSEGRLQVFNFTWLIPGVGDVTELSHQGIASIFQNPFLNLYAAVASNKTFSGAPLYYEWEDPEVKYWRVFGYAWHQLMPAMFGSDIAAIVRSLEHIPGAMTTGQLAASQFGLRTYPLDEELMMRRKIGREQQLLREKLSVMRKERERAATPEEVTEWEERWRELLSQPPE